MKDNRGLTLVEIIIAVALLGVIAIGVIPAFTSQIMVLNQGKTLTAGAFSAQSEVEEAIQDIQTRIHDLQPLDTVEGLTTVQRTFWGRTVNINRLARVFPDNENKTIFVYLSRRLAEAMESTLLTVSNVRIDVSDTADDSIADMRLTPEPTLEALFDDNSAQAGFYTNLFTWYVSNEGVSDPQFPADYVPLSFPGIDPKTVADLLTVAGANRYMMVEVTPVDIHGLRGDPVSSTNRVLVLGQEWRSGTFPWIDKNNNGNLEGTDLPLSADRIQAAFDSHLTFPNPSNPSETSDPSDGALYVPMRVDPAAGAIAVSGAEQIDWITDRSIHMAKDLAVSNGTDITMQAREGNITFYQYALLDGSGNPQYGADGKVRTINDGPNLTTTGDIRLETLARGMIGINDYTWLEGKELAFVANSQMYAKKATLRASGNILMDTSRNIGITGNRDLMIDDSTVELKASAASGRAVSLKSRNAVVISDSEFIGNPTVASSLSISAKGSITLTGTDLTNINLTVDNDASILGGGWSAGRSVTVPNGKTLTLGASSGRVNNAGSLVLGNTGAVDFVTSMVADLQRPLTLSLTKSSDDTVTVGTDYGRNVAYAEAMGSESVDSANVYQPLGSGSTNLLFTADQTASSITNLQSLTYSFDGSGTITITGEASGPVSASVILKVKDAYADNQVEGAIQFSVTASDAGPAIITVLDPIIPVYVTGISVSSPADEIYAGETLQMTATVSPSDATNQTVTWSVPAGASYATINSSGLLSGVLPGAVTVRATANDGTLVYGEKAVTIRQPLIPLAQTTGVQLSALSGGSASSRGVVTWGDVANEVGYRIQLMKNGTDIGEPINVPASPRSYNLYSAIRANGAGDYTVKVAARGNGTVYSDGPYSAASSPARTMYQMAVPGSLVWDGFDADWSYVPNNNDYRVQLYRNGEPYGSAVVTGSSDYDFTDEIEDGGSANYQFTVQTLATTNAQYVDSEISAMSPVLSAVIVAREWTFNNNTQGWSAASDISNFSQSDSDPGYISGNINDVDPYIVSGTNLGTGITNAKTIEIRLRNLTASTGAQIYFITNAEQGWDEAKHKDFGILANSGYMTYTIDMSDNTHWTGTLRQLRIDPAVGVSSGSFRIDYIRIY